ncbi:hypothetical protein V5F29_15860 [Xanthobacter aminoxidans]|uniref:hypothetical protein n=1 Tax=Xanthobacter aminoxidans TaxID=186280 RepID=UPI00372A6C70
MNATDSLLVPLVDAGGLNGLKHAALGARYRFWRDEDGLRHVFSVYRPDAAPDYPDALAVVSRRTPAGSIAMWAGPASHARTAALRMRGDEIHIHVFGEENAPALRRLMDRSLMGRTSMERGEVPALPRPAVQALCLPARRHAA